MADLTLDEIALKNKFLERSGRPDWTEEDFKAAAFDHNSRVDMILTELREIGSHEVLTNENLLRLSRALTSFVEKNSAEIGERQIKVAGFEVMAAHPVKRFSYQAINYFLAVALGAAATYFIVTHGVGA